VSIVRRIKREARNSPAKAALLAGLLGLALYCWAPLVMTWLTVDEESSQAASSSDAEPDQPEQPASRTTASENTIDEKKRPKWHELRQWRQDSPWTAPADLAHMRDPFRVVPGTEEPVAKSEEIESSPVTTPEQTINGLKIQLTGTIVGPRRRVALLDGRAYREGDVVLVEHLGTTWKLEIRRIEANRVRLGWQSIERDLVAPDRQRVGRIELVEHSR
jgi:hypothetical protein